MSRSTCQACKSAIQSQNCEPHGVQYLESNVNMQLHKLGIDRTQWYKSQKHEDSFLTTAIRAPHRMEVSSSNQWNLPPCKKHDQQLKWKLLLPHPIIKKK